MCMLAYCQHNLVCFNKEFKIATFAVLQSRYEDRKSMVKFYPPKERAATKAVIILLAQRTAAWPKSTYPLEMAPKPMAATAARKPTTVAWT